MDGWLAGWLVGRSKSRTRSTLASAVTVRYTLSVTCVSRVCDKISRSMKKNRELTVNAIGDTAILREEEVEPRI